MRRRLVLVGCCGLMAVAVVTWVAMPGTQPIPSSDRWRMTVVERESLMASALASASCSLGHDVELVREKPLPSVDEAGSEASCEYLVRVADWPEGELECVLEYRVSTFRAEERGL